MKQLLVIVFVCILSVVNAQFEKGNRYVGGNLFVSYQLQSVVRKDPTNNISGKGFAISINPQFLKASNSSTLKGFTLGYNFLHRKQTKI